LNQRQDGASRQVNDQRRGSSRLEKLVAWSIFTVLIALVPFCLLFFESIDRNRPVSFYSIFGTGQLLLVCVVITSAALGELIVINLSPDQLIVKLIAIGSCIVAIILSSLWFADISADLIHHPPPDPKTVSIGSVVFYIWSLVSSAWCLILTTRSSPAEARQGPSYPQPSPPSPAPLPVSRTTPGRPSDPNLALPSDDASVGGEE
jgi:hypothetical protein